MNRRQKIINTLTQFENDLERLISIPSILDETHSDYPFGKEIQLALESTLSIAKALGYDTYIDPNGYYGYAQIGSGTELFGVLGHVDVVPTGNISKWNTNPFKLEIKDDKYYGRGVSDDKGPLLASMYALKLMLDDGYTPTQRIRFIFGCDEESLWRCMSRYEKIEEMPNMGFSPDSTFPLIYAEKALVQVELSANDEIDFTFSGGNALNTVPESAIINYGSNIIENLNHMQFKYSVANNKIEVIGKSCHAQSCDKGINAITHLAQALSFKQNESSLLKFILERGKDPNGVDLFGIIADDASGKLMFNIGKASFEAHKQTIGIDMRIPVSYDTSTLIQTLKDVCLEYKLEFKQIDFLRSIHVKKESKLVTSLMKAYQEVTKDYESQPTASGGATYARAMDNCVAFGAILPNSAKTAHQINEFILKEDIITAIEIYMKSFELLVLQEEKNEEI